MSFIESPRFPDKISFGSSGGPGFNTDVITVNSGYETRNQNWVEARHEYDAAFGVTSEPRLSELIKFFQAMAGKMHTFRYKDFGDYLSCDLQSIPASTDQIIGTGDSSDGTVSDTFTGSITSIDTQRTTFRDTTRTEADDFFNGLILTFTNGLNNGLTATITDYVGATDQFIIESSNLASDLTIGDTYSITKNYTSDFQLIKNYIAGLTQVRDITKPVTGTVLIAVDSVLKTETTDYTIDYTTGIITFLDTKLPLIGEIVTAGYEFDVPCRFDTDQLNITFDAYSIGSTSVPIIEVRI